MVDVMVKKMDNGHTNYEAWLYEKDIGIKSFIFSTNEAGLKGVRYNDDGNDLEAFLDLVNNALTTEMYIEDYIEDFMEE